MGVLGKILVFVNLVFSLLTAGLIIVVFTTRSNWKDAYDKQSKNMAIVQASAQASETAAAEQVRLKDSEVQKLKGERKAAEDARAKTQEDLQKAQADLKALNDSFVKNTTNSDAFTQELTRRAKPNSKHCKNCSASTIRESAISICRWPSFATKRSVTRSNTKPPKKRSPA